MKTKHPSWLRDIQRQINSGPISGAEFSRIADVLILARYGERRYCGECGEWLHPERKSFCGKACQTKHHTKTTQKKWKRQQIETLSDYYIKQQLSQRRTTR